MTKLITKIAMALILTSLTNSVFAVEVHESDTLASKQEIALAINKIGELDPRSSDASATLMNLCETLVNSGNLGDIVPAAAASWDTKDNKMFVFNLQRNAKWSNGKPVTADDFVYSFRKAVDKDSTKTVQAYFSRMSIKNVDAIRSGKLPASAIGVKALDKYKLQIELEKPTHYFLQMLTHIRTSPIYKENFEKYPTSWSTKDKFVCNGAYSLSSISDEKIEMVRNKYYWNNAKTHINKATWFKSKSIADDAEKFFKGQLQATYRIPIERFWVYEKDYPEEIINSDKITSYYLGINSQRYPLDDEKVRQALSYAIDRNILTFAYLAQGHKPSYSFTPINVNGYNVGLPDYAKLTQKQRNEKAHQLLKEAGFSVKKPLVITISYEHTDRNIINYQAVSAIKNILEGSLGTSIKVILDPIYERKDYLTKIKERDYQIMRRGATGTYNDAIAFLNAFISTNDSLNIGYKNSKYDAIMQKVANTVKAEDRQKLFAQAEAILQKDMPVIPLYRGGHSRLISSKIGNYPSGNQEEKVYIKNLYIRN